MTRIRALTGALATGSLALALAGTASAQNDIDITGGGSSPVGEILVIRSQPTTTGEGQAIPGSATQDLVGPPVILNDNIIQVDIATSGGTTVASNAILELAGSITGLHLPKTRIYGPNSTDEHKDDIAFIALFQKA